MSKQEEIKQALAAASTEHEWDTDGTFIQWKDGHVLQGTYRQIAITEAPNPEVFNNPNHENDANLIAKAPEYIAYLLKELEEKEELAEKRLLEAQDWEDEYHALKRRYEELDRSALEKHELLMDTSAKFQAVSKELEEARKISFPRQANGEGGWEIDFALLRKIQKLKSEYPCNSTLEEIESVLLVLEAFWGQEGEGNQDE